MLFVPSCQIGREIEGYLWGNAQTDLTTGLDHFVVRAKREEGGRIVKALLESCAVLNAYFSRNPLGAFDL